VSDWRGQIGDVNNLLDVTSAYDTVSGLEDWVEFDSVQGATEVAITDAAARLTKEYFPKLQASKLKYRALVRPRGNHSQLPGLRREILVNYKNM
jgi:hypothetical protein